MNPLLSPLTGSLVGTVVLVWVYLHLYREDRSRYLALFAAAWLVDGTRHALGLLVVLGAPAELDWAAVVTAPVFAGLLLAGARQFRSKPMHRAWPVALALGSAGSIAALIAGVSLPGVGTPAFVVAGLAVMAAGVELIGPRESQHRGRYVAGVASALLGLQLVAHPLLRSLGAFAASGHVVSGTLESVVAVGALLMHLSRTQRALQEQSRLLQGVVDRAGSFVVVKDLEGRRILVNRPFVEHGERANELEALVEAHERDAIHADAPLRAEQAVGDRIFDVTCFPLTDAKGAPFAVGVIYTDVTERRQLQSRLLDASKLEALGTLARGVVHDLNNLLTVFAGHSAELSKRYPGDGDVAGIRSAVHRGETLARGLLAFASRQRLSPRAVDLDELAAASRTLLERSVGEHVVVELRRAAGPCRTRVDTEQMEVVLGNLALNARDAMPDGGKVEIETALVEVDAARANAGGVAPGLYAMLSFRDTGTGMSAETRAHMFDPFFTTKPAGLGSGLGLATVYGAIKQSGGFIEVDSEPEQGTEVRILLPHADEQGRASSRKLRSATPIGKPAAATVLVVEDDPSVRHVVARTLKAHGYAVLQASDGEQGLARAASVGSRLALIVTDVEMPRLGGVEMVERLTAARPGIPVLFMSGYTDAVDRIARGHADRDFIQKPFEPQLLLERVAVLLGDGVPESEIRARETASPDSGGARRSSS